jgi:hypothetical protein
MDVDTPQPFRFLDLPAELRLHIYEVLLLDPESYVLPVANLPPTRPNRSKSIYPAILRTSKAVYSEALPVLYSGNTFMIRSFPPKFCVPELTAYIGEKNAGLIRRVFTIGRQGVKLDEEQLKEKYEAMGVQWDKLHVWACRGLERGAPEEWIEEAGNGGWIENVDVPGMRKLGLKEQWFSFARGLGHGDNSDIDLDQESEDSGVYTKGSGWVVKRGSTTRVL